MTLATFARIEFHIDPTLPPGQRSVPGDPDPRTATCHRHRVAAPYSDTAKGDGTDVPESNGWECVVCPLPDSDLIGAEVIARGTSGVYLFGGPDPDRHVNGGGGCSIAFSLRGLPSVIRCAVEDVAPADTPTDEKDPRITIEKLPKKRDYQDNGPWLPSIDHPRFADWRPAAEKTKRDALAGAARRLAIADYQDRRAS